MTKHKCPSGEYYCYTDKKCKPIPKGFKMVGPAGYLRKENGHSVEDEAETKKNGNGSNGNGNGNGGGSVSEANKSGDSSLRDWFGKSRSSDGKPGWVQLGGKYAGKPCAKQPGQTTKPKCGSSKMKRNLNKDEEEAAFRRKQKEDPNPNRKGKAINVKTEATINERGDYWHPDPDKDRKLGGPGANQRAREDRGAKSSSSSSSDSKKLKKGESYMDYAKRQKASKKPRYSPELQKRIDAAKAKKKEGLGGKIMRKLGMKREEVEVLSFGAYLSEGNRTGRMMQKSKTQVTGHISADRGSDEKKNREGRKNLEKDLKKHGIGHKKGVGEYKYDSGETGREVSYQTSKPDKMSKRRFGKVMRRMGRKHGQESVITKDKDKPAKLHYTEKGSKAKSDSIGKTKAGKHPEGYGETSGTKVRGGKLPKKTNKSSYHYG